MATNVEQPETEEPLGQQTETGLDENVAAALSYVLGFLTGIVMFLIESENDHVRFHAAQSVVTFGALFVVLMALNVVQAIAGFSDIIGLILGPVFGLLSLVLSLGGFVLWVYLIVRTYRGQDPRIPVAAHVAEGVV
ncbi:MAG: hypothetical protein V5A44_03180 [Haloarculaceae archaeon]